MFTSEDFDWRGHTSRPEDLVELTALINEHGSQRMRRFADAVLITGDIIVIYKQKEGQ